MIADATARPVEILTATALIYLAISLLATRIITAYEQRFLRKLRL